MDGLKMIEKLDEDLMNESETYYRIKVIEKLNEIIDEVNFVSRIMRKI